MKKRQEKIPNDYKFILETRWDDSESLLFTALHLRHQASSLGGGYEKKLRETLAGNKILTLADVANATTAFQKSAVEILDPAKEEVDISLPENNPIILHVADTHYSSYFTNAQAIDALFEFVLTHRNAYLGFYGDAVEGINPDMLDTVVTQTGLNFGQQLRGFRDRYLIPVALQRKLLFVVVNYAGHDEWLENKMTVDPWTLMLDGVPGVKFVYNGGRVRLHFPDGRTDILQVAHNAGKGGSEKKPVGHLRKLSQRVGLPWPNLVAAGHFHELKAAGVDVSENGDRRVLLALGTAKTGPDRFTGFSASRGAPLGNATIHRSCMGKDSSLITPTTTLEKADTLSRAFEVLNLAIQKREDRELIAEIERKGGRRLSLDRVPGGSSRVKERRYQVQPFDRIHYVFDGLLPIQLFFIQNLRYRSATTNLRQFQDIQSAVIARKGTFAVYGRKMLNGNVFKDPDPYLTVDQLADLMSPVTNQEKGKALLIGTEMRDDRWKKLPAVANRDEAGNLVRPKAREKFPRHFEPGSQIALKTGLPLLENQGEIVLVSRKGPRYSIFLLDHLEWSGSSDDPTQGLVTVEERAAWGRKDHDIIAGGHMPMTGTLEYWSFRTQTHKIAVAPGWLSV